jgi:transcriptional regulator with XRE-family HTH domain
MDTLSVRKFAERLDMAPTTLQEYLKGRMPPADFIVRVCERLEINPWWLLAGNGEMKSTQPVVTADPAPLYLTEMSPERKKKAKLGNMLNRIIDEGDSKKIKAVESQLDLLDPGEKKSSHSHEDDGSGGYMGGVVA